MLGYQLVIIKSTMKMLPSVVVPCTTGPKAVRTSRSIKLKRVSSLRCTHRFFVLVFVKVLSLLFPGITPSITRYPDDPPVEGLLNI
jgi:hypothetical protein